MKVILSRKGFDASAGGVASPILPDGRMFSLPIPDRHSPIRFADIAPHGPLVPELTRGKVKLHYGAHLDPDLVAESIPRPVGWKPLFGQTDADQRVLEREGVGPGDLFVYFGWFRQVEQRDGRYQYVRGAPDVHVIWGWLQVGQVLKVGTDAIPDWAGYHPHAVAAGRWRHNAMYVAAETLTVGGAGRRVPGACVFARYDERLRLTAPGAGRSTWSLPDWFYPTGGKTPLGYHGDASRWSRDGDRVLLKTVGRGQEFVLDAEEYPEIVGWATELEMTGRTGLNCPEGDYRTVDLGRPD